MLGGQPEKWELLGKGEVIQAQLIFLFLLKSWIRHFFQELWFLLVVFRNQDLGAQLLWGFLCF